MEMESERLSFVRQEEGGGLIFWALDASSLDYSQQCQLGKAMAQELVASVRETAATPHLGWMVFDWLKARQQRGPDADMGVMVGFCNEVVAIAAGFRPLIQRG